MRPTVLFLVVLVATPASASSAASQATPPARDSAAASAVDSIAKRPRRTFKLQPVTPELERTAFHDDAARTLLARARVARLAQDSALRAYDAKSFLRLSLGARLRLGPERLMFRHEQSARVQWSRASGLWIEPTGRRTAFPMGHADVDFTEDTPIPYVPGRDMLWTPGGEKPARAEQLDEGWVHPLAAGAEAYYRYATGDSMSIRLLDRRVVALRELRITPRRPDAHTVVGSFWFDASSGHLVRAGYRLAADLEPFQQAIAEHGVRVAELEERARTDTGALGRAARRAADSLRLGWRDRLTLKLVQGLMPPVRARLAAVTVEYMLVEGRFWLPRLNTAEAEFEIGPARTPMRWEESFRYASVNGTDTLPVVGDPVTLGLTPEDTAWIAGGNVIMGGGRPRVDTSTAAGLAREDSAIRQLHAHVDSLREQAARVRAKGDTSEAREIEEHAARDAIRARAVARRRQRCGATDSTYVAGMASRYDGSVRVAIRMPCDTSRLARSPDLPGSVYGDGEELFGAADREQLVEALGLSLQPGWAPRPPTIHAGLDLVRYNRIEGLSVGLSATAPLGSGYTAQAVGRFGFADRVPNGELALARSNGRTEITGAIFHRLAVANDDWGAPLGFGASLANLLYARDEGFYHRAAGVELRGAHAAPALFGSRVGWRLFAERQRSAGVAPNTQASLGRAFGDDARFTANIAASPLAALGAAGELSRGVGADPRRAHLDLRARAEATLVDGRAAEPSGYGRLVLDASLAQPIGRVAIGLGAAAGSSVGTLPTQRAFYVGGLHTVRGQFARAEGAGRVGDAFWLARGEVGARSRALRPSLFYDVGWAGPRADWARAGRPLSGAGVGLSVLDGFLRVEVARGIAPERRWRGDLYLQARF